MKSLKDNAKDGKLSSFHALGKILYSKRDASGKLDFHPERVVEMGDLSMEGTLAFLFHHTVNFCTDVGDIADSFESYSDCDVLLRREYDGLRDRGDTVFPTEYCKSLLGRTSGAMNKNPAPSSWRALSAPTIFDARRKASENHTTIDRLREDFLFGNLLPKSSMSGGGKTFFCDVLPYARIIVPDKANPPLLSYIRDQADASIKSKWKKIDKPLQIEQFISSIVHDEGCQEVLLEDDIEEDIEEGK